jgi:hypothetical protein
MLILDEAHLFCTQLRLTKIMALCPEYILALTATPNKPNGMEVIMQMTVGVHAVPLANKLPIHVWKHETGIAVPFLKNKQSKPDWMQMIKWLNDHPTRDNIILEWVRLNPTRKIAVMTLLKDHGKKLYQLFKDAGESVGLMMGTTKSYESCRVLILGVKKGGTGFDEANQCVDFDPLSGRIDTLIICQSLKSALIQVTGRAFRSSNPHIIHLMDKGPIFKNHWDEAELYYKNPKLLQGEISIHVVDEPTTLPFPTN